ncbi:hypothetical protein RKLH11_97 [Rhodobacteraceae bacterium KLH11]|nr:hypothetical protein RKLH11_97 [Rhodobacteraceae bacterium KLH11]
MTQRCDCCACEIILRKIHVCLSFYAEYSTGLNQKLGGTDW